MPNPTTPSNLAQALHNLVRLRRPRHVAGRITNGALTVRDRDLITDVTVLPAPVTRLDTRRPAQTVEQHAAHEVITNLRPRRKTCGCGEPATRAVRSTRPGQAPENYCPSCLPIGSGIYGVIDGGRSAGSDGAA